MLDTTSGGVEISPLAHAARLGDWRQVRGLLEAQADPNVQDSLGETPLFEAVACGNINVVAELLLNGADPEWVSTIDTAASDFSDETSIRALLKVSSGELITEEEENEILAAVDLSLSRPLLRFIQSLSGKDVAFEMMRGDSEQTPPVRLESDNAVRSCTPPFEVEIVVIHAINGSKLSLRVPGKSTFADIKKAIQQRLHSNDGRVPNIYLVHKEADAYVAYRDRDPVGSVRLVHMIGATLPG